VRATVKLIAQADGYATPIYLPEDPGQAGQSQIVDYVNHLAGYSVTPIRMTGSKEQRAMLVATRVNIGQVGLLKAPWNAALLDELQSFPNGRHDDQVDALSLAFDQLSARPPMRIDPAVIRDWALIPASFQPSLGYYGH
jgi:predicted phage terminase large subunit-like protein